MVSPGAAPPSCATGAVSSSTVQALVFLMFFLDKFKIHVFFGCFFLCRYFILLFALSCLFVVQQLILPCLMWLTL